MIGQGNDKVAPLTLKLLLEVERTPVILPKLVSITVILTEALAEVDKEINSEKFMEIVNAVGGTVAAGSGKRSTNVGATVPKINIRSIKAQSTTNTTNTKCHEQSAGMM